MNTVYLIQNQWFAIGTRLKLSEADLTEMWNEATRADVFSKETYCCCKMLDHWFNKAGKNLSNDSFLEAVEFAPLGLEKKISTIKSLLANKAVDKAVYADTADELDETEKKYALMIAEVVKIIKSDTTLDVFKLVLRHSKNIHTNKRKIDELVYEKASSFSTLIDSLQSSGFITHTELSWLKYLVHDVAKSDEALSVIKRYEESNIAHKVYWKNLSKTEHLQGTYIVAKTSKDPSMLTGDDISQTKSAAVKMVGLHETDILFNSAGVGSVIIYWKLYSDAVVELPDTITPVLKKMCYATNITHIGTIVNQTTTLIETVKLKTGPISELNNCEMWL